MPQELKAFFSFLFCSAYIYVINSSNPCLSFIKPFFFSTFFKASFINCQKTTLVEFLATCLFIVTTNLRPRLEALCQNHMHTN